MHIHHLSSGALILLGFCFLALMALAFSRD